MAIAIIDSFDIYPDVAATSYGLQGCWTIANPGLSFTLVGGRFGGQAVQVRAQNVPAFMGQPVAGTDFAMGFATRLENNIPEAGAVAFFRQTDANGNLICGVGMNASQQYYLWVTTPANIVAVAAAPVAAGAWHYLECIAHIDGAAGTLALYMDGFAVASFAGPIPNGPAAYAALGTPSNSSPAWFHSYDDFYLATSTTRIGEMRIEILYPNSDVQKQWTPLNGVNNFAMVNEVRADGDASYVSSATVGQEDLYGIASLTGVPVTIAAVQLRVCAEKDDSATRTLAGSLKSGATLVHGATFPVAFNSYGYQRDIFATDPNTAAAWTTTAVNAAQIGQKVIS